MIVYASKSQDDFLLIDMLPTEKLMYVATIFFLIQLISVPIMASVVKQLGKVAGIDPSYQSAFILAAVAPTPLWLSAVSLFAPNFLIIISFGTLALMASAGLIFYGIPVIFKMEKKGNVVMYFGSVIITGLIALALLMLLTLIIWGNVQDLKF